jgi:hypothetical protein
MSKLARNIEWLSSLSIVNRVNMGRVKVSPHNFPTGHIKFRRRVIGGVFFYGYDEEGTNLIFVRVDEDYHERLLELVAKKMEFND